MSGPDPPHVIHQTVNGLQRPAPRLIPPRLAVSALLAIVVLATILLRLNLILSKEGVDHDEGITYLAATGHQGEYARLVVPGRGLVGTWVEAAEWKRLIRPEQPFVFHTIGSDLARYDIHPPLYFWLLHLWVAVFGVSMASGPLFNLPVAALAALALFMFARRLVGDSLAACAVTAVWALNLQVIQVSVLARQYDLLGLFTVLFAWQTHRFNDPSRRPRAIDIALLAMIVAAGALTHYHFAIVIAGGAAFVATTTWWTRDAKRLVPFLVALTLGCLIFLAAHPSFARSFPRQVRQTQTFSQAALAQRIDRATNTIARFVGMVPGTKVPLAEVPARALRAFVPGGTRAPLVLAAVTVAAVTILLARSASRRAVSRRLRRAPRTGLSALFFLAWTLGTVVFLYLTFLSPEHAIGARHLAVVWPFLAFVPFFAFRLLSPRAGWWLTLLFCVLVLLPESVAVARPWIFVPGASGPETVRAREVVFDNPARGVLTRLLFHVTDTARIFVDTQLELLRQPTRWADSLHAGALYVSQIDYASTRQGQQQLVNLLSERYTLKPGRWPSRPAPDVYEIDTRIGR